MLGIDDRGLRGWTRMNKCDVGRSATGFASYVRRAQSELLRVEQVVGFLVVHVFFGGDGFAGGDAFFDLFAFEVGDHGFDGLVAHVDGVLEDDGLDVAVLESFDHAVAGIEADVGDFAGEAFVDQRFHHAGGTTFVDGEDAVDIFAEFLQQALRLIEGRLLGGSGVLVGGEDFDVGEFLGDRVEETFFAVLGTFAAGAVAKEDDVALAAQSLAEFFGGEFSAMLVIGGDVADVEVGIFQTAIEDHDGNVGFLGLLDNADE